MPSPVHQISSHSTPDVSALQERVAAALAQGKTISAAAAENKLHRTTVHGWIRSSDSFRAAVAAARAESRHALADRLHEAFTLSLATIRSLILDPGTPPGIRLKVALAVLDRPELFQPEQPEPEPAPEAAAARNSPCPCGSGAKFKRCCGVSSPPVLGRPRTFAAQATMGVRCEPSSPPPTSPHPANSASLQATS